MSVSELNLVIGESHKLWIEPCNALTNFSESRAFLIDQESREELAILNVYPNDSLFFAYWKSALIKSSIEEKAFKCLNYYCSRYKKTGLPILGFNERARLTNYLYPDISDQYELLVKPLIANSWDCLSESSGAEADEASLCFNSPIGEFWAFEGEHAQTYVGLVSSVSDTEGFANFMQDTMGLGMAMTTREARQFFSVPLGNLKF